MRVGGDIHKRLFRLIPQLKAGARPPQDRTQLAGMTVEQRGYGGRTVIKGLSSGQVDLVEPRLDRYGPISIDRLNTPGLL